MEQQGIRAYVPLPNWENKTGYLGSNHFTYDPERDVYICPQDQPLRRRTNEYTVRKVECRARAEDCNKILARYSQAAGFAQPISPHKLRHFLLTWLKKQGIDDAAIQPYSGHASRPAASRWRFTPGWR